MHQATGQQAAPYRMGERAFLLAREHCADQLAYHQAKVAEWTAKIAPHAESCGLCSRALRNGGKAATCKTGAELFRWLRHHERQAKHQQWRQETELASQLVIPGC
jgi:hypothetical protein